MDTHQETFTTWNSLAEAYRERFMDFDLYDETYRVFCRLLPEYAEVLELGCGPGNVSRFLLQERADLQVLATDYAPNMVEMAQREVPQMKTQVLDARELGNLEGSYHGIVCGFLLPYLSMEATEKLAQSCSEKLKKSGYLYWSYVPGNPMDSGFLTGSTGLRSYFQYHDPDTIESYLLHAGFQILETWDIPYKKTGTTEEVHRICILQKITT